MLIVSAALWFGITTAGLSRLLRQRPQTAHRRRCSCKWVSFSSARTLSFMGRTACSTANACGAITRSTIRPRSWNRSLRRAFTRSTWFLGSVTADVVMVLMGVSPNVLVVLGPFTIAHFGLRPRQSRLDAWPFKYVIAGRSSIAGTTPPRIAAIRRILRRHSRSWLCCSARSTCRPMSVPTAMALPSANFRLAYRFSSCAFTQSVLRKAAPPQRGIFRKIVKQTSPSRL